MASVFWSWQSDAPHRETRGIIKEALDLAVAKQNSSVDAAERPDSQLEVDHDTKGLSGSPDIVTSILNKIESASAFVADVTPIGVVKSDKGERHVQNPNVLIELGFAKKALGLERVIQVWNTAITDCTIEDLAFDMRGRRGPISFKLAQGSPTDKYREAREELAKALSSALSMINPKEQEAKPWPKWAGHNPDNPAIWFDEGTLITVNEADHGSGTKLFPRAPTRYVRVLPKEWNKPEHLDHASMLGYISGITWGRVRGGMLTYQGTVMKPELAESSNGTMQFFNTGEVWAIDRQIVAPWRDKMMVSGDDMIPEMVGFLSRQISRMLGQGAKLPFKIKLGSSGLLGSYWPVRNPGFGEPQALDDVVEVESEILKFHSGQVQELISQFWAEFRDNYGIGLPDHEQVANVMKNFEHSR